MIKFRIGIIWCNDFIKYFCRVFVFHPCNHDIGLEKLSIQYEHDLLLYPVHLMVPVKIFIFNTTKFEYRRFYLKIFYCSYNYNSQQYKCYRIYTLFAKIMYYATKQKKIIFEYNPKVEFYVQVQMQYDVASCTASRKTNLLP